MGRAAAVAGVLAAGMALAVGEAVAAVTGGPSLVVAVGDVVVDLAPGWLVRRTIDLLGTTQKPALLIGIVVVTLLAGGALGRNVGGGRRTVRAAFVAFGLGGSGAAAWSGAPIRGLVSGLVAASVGIAVLEAGLRRVPVSGLPPNDPATDPPTAVPLEDPRVKATTRRGFITYAAGVSVAAGAVAVGSRALARRGTDGLRAQVLLPSTRRTADDRRATTTTTTEGPWPPMPGHSRWVTPNDDFYRIDTALTVPIVDPTDWSLTLNGLVAEPVTLTLDDLLAMDVLDATVTLACVSNPVGGPLIGNAVWTGVLLTDVLDLVDPLPEAEQVLAWSVDGFSAGFPLATAVDGRTALVAFGMNGEPLPLAHGFPVRLVVPGLYGYVSAVKWLSQLELSRFDRDGFWIDKGWSKDAPVKISSRIDVPVQNRVEAGTVPVAGVAWYPDVGVAAVEVSVDFGPWQACRLGEADGPGLEGEAWVQWLHLWEPEPGRYRIRVRAFGSDGTMQSPERVAPAPNGAEGYHEISVTVT